MAETVEGGVRREFSLSDEDTTFLDGLGTPWHAAKHGGQQWIIIHDWQVPDGYNMQTVRIALLIPPSYPAVQIDMAFFSLPLERADKKPINGLTMQPVCCESFQQWSRHRRDPNLWRRGVDNIANHLDYVFEWLKEELKR